MAQEAVGIEQRTREEPVPMPPGDDLATVQMSSEDQVIAFVSRGLPDARIVGAQDSDVAVLLIAPLRMMRAPRP